MREQKRVGKTLRHFICDEFYDFLECGIPENGFVRTYCFICGHSGIVPFSCKRRGFCPSCCARRMNDEAAHLVDAVIPEIPTRQWVLSFPFNMRYLMARNQDLLNKALRIYIQQIHSFQKRKIVLREIVNMLPYSQLEKESIVEALEALNLDSSFRQLSFERLAVFLTEIFLPVSDGYRASFLNHIAKVRSEE